MNFNSASCIYLACILIAASSCKDGPSLSPATSHGANTFSCRIEKVIWVPDGYTDLGGRIKPVSGGFTSNIINDTLNLFISAKSKNGTEIEIFLRHPTEGAHLLNARTHRRSQNFYPLNYAWYKDARGNEYITTDLSEGSVHVSKSDSNSGIVAGTFSFTAVNTTGQKVRITEGRFDINTKTL